MNCIWCNEESKEDFCCKNCQKAFKKDELKTEVFKWLRESRGGLLK